MKLYITIPSPFARKCRIVAREKGLADRVEEVVTDLYGNAPELAALNPVDQVPSLIAEDGLALNDSPVICEYFDAIGSGPRLLPQSGSAWLAVKRTETLGNAALEMGVKWVLEKRRPEGERSPAWMQRWSNRMGRCLDALEAADLSADRLDMGVITAGCAVTWIDFRHPEFDWKTGRPNLVALQAALETRPSFADTRPDAPA
jgi:glutathione S-transferase